MCKMSKKKSLVVSFIVILSAFMLPFNACAASDNPLTQIKTYKIYYDSPTPDLLKKMQELDAVMIEPVFYSQEQIQMIQQSGTKVYGYINIMEADKWNTELFNQLNEYDFFYRNQKRVYYPEWDSYLTDITSIHYQEILLNEVTTQISAKGLDGIFLDTVGNIDNEHWNNQDILKEQRNGLVSLLQRIQEKHPKLSMIQNWGFDTLKTATSPYVDGIMWENFNYSTVSNDQWSQNRIKDLKTLRQQSGIQTLTVSFAENTNSTNYAESLGFIHYHEPDHYNAW